LFKGRNVHFFVLYLWLASILLASPYNEGKKLYFSKGCNGCHGINASGTNQYPALAYRRKPFLETKLKEYRAKKASTQLAQMMIPFALELKDNEIDALTTFLSEFNENKKSPTNKFSIKGDGGS
jgi:cytochrome c553